MAVAIRVLAEADSLGEQHPGNVDQTGGVTYSRNIVVARCLWDGPDMVGCALKSRHGSLDLEHGAPDRSLLFLGYAGWDAGQLDAELHENAWLACDADLDLIFSIDPEKKYPAAMARMGIDLGKLSSDQGQA